jgi:hypothetical protein
VRRAFLLPELAHTRTQFWSARAVIDAVLMRFFRAMIDEVLLRFFKGGD